MCTDYIYPYTVQSQVKVDWENILLLCTVDSGNYKFGPEGYQSQKGGLQLSFITFSP